MLPTIEIKTGSATSPQPENGRGVLVAHICNDVGAWASGFVLAVNKVSMAGKAAYKAWAKDHNDSIPRGRVQLVELKPDVFVANMIAQRGVDKSASTDGCLVDYVALKQCLVILFKRALQLRCDVHIPAGIGSGLAGGDRTMIHQMIRAEADTIQATYDMVEDGALTEKNGVNVTLWEFTDTTSDSFVAPPPHPTAPTATASPTVPSSVPDSILGTPTEDEL